ncbi:unnamed protein product [Blepharisma stoltei]|uniref:CNNM transmembrane domain-containing protein n=1 Tax=Blepharisma stoltei TaxID=1481888 RepID=A0AAU9J699_9CILI|nr:unnamed protein product [Blepharisma stoltei]
MIIYLFLLIQAEAIALVEEQSIEVYTVYSVISLGLVFISGLMSGLTVGLLSLDEFYLELKLESGTSSEKKQAEKILSTISNHHLVLVTLLLGNAAAMEALPLFLEAIVSPILSIVISVLFVMIFGEIFPQAICTGPDQLKIAYRMCPVVKFITVLLFPLSYPIAKLLDKVFGIKDSTKKLKHDELKTLISLHQAIVNSENERRKSGLFIRQIKIIHGAMDLGKEIVKDHMIPYQKMYCLSNDTILGKKKLKEVLVQGYSRVPIYNGEFKNDIIGILMVKTLLGVEKGKAIKDLKIPLKNPFFVRSRMTLLELLQKFKFEKIQMAIIRDDDIVEGLITFEDLMEQILKTDILDEDDYDKLTGFVAGNIIRARTQIIRPVRTII